MSGRNGSPNMAPKQSTASKIIGDLIVMRTETSGTNFSLR